MTSQLLPASIPTRLAAVLCGRSLASFKRHVLPLVATPDDRGRVAVHLAALEWHLQAPITPETYLFAERRLDALRSTERANKNRHAARRSDAAR